MPELPEVETIAAGVHARVHGQRIARVWTSGKPQTFNSPESEIVAALTGARIRLRPILMTSLAFVFGCIPLWIASGAGGVSRRILGTVVIGGMLAATCIAIFLIPVTFFVVEKFALRFKKPPKPPPQEGEEP